MASSTQSLYSAQISGSENVETPNISRFSFNSSEPGINSSQSSHPILPESTPTDTTDTNGVVEHPPDRLRHQNPSNQNPEAIKSYIRRRRNLRVWWFEILMCFVVIGALLAIVATLLSYHDQPIPHWPYGISINAIISIYITILKAMLVALVSQGLGQLKWTWFQRPRPLNDLETFDNASRGLIGAMNLLWSIRGRDVIAYSGTVVFVLSTILDPFSQQTVRFYSCRRLDDSGTKASINTTNYISDTHGPIGPDGIGEISLAMQIEIQKAIIDSTEARVSFYCPSGNFTFTGGYKSIGFCDSCADTSDQINVFQDPNGKFTNYSTPVFTLTHETTTDITGSFGMSYNDSSPGIDYNDPPSGAMHFYSIAAWSKKLPESACTTAEKNPWRCRGYGAAVCTISPCVQTLTSTVELNQLHEVEIAPSGAVWGKTDGTNIGRTIDTSCVNQTEKNILQAKEYEFDKDTPWIPFRIAWQARENDNYAEIRRECVYEYDVWDIDAISLFAKDYFEGIAISGGSDPVVGNLSIC